MSSKKVLIVLSDADHFPLHKHGDTKAEPSGFFLIEPAKPLQKLLDSGYEVTFASPEGKEPKVDPGSQSLMVYAGNYLEKQRENELIERMRRDNGLARPKTFSELSDDNLKSYAGVFIPGDTHLLPTLATMPSWVAFFTTSIPRTSPRLPSVTDRYKITSWSDNEEKSMDFLKQGEIDKVESSLREAGADMQTGLGEKAGYITVDREVVSGGNPLAANSLADKFLEMLEA